jgi:plasmid rolling circle replication initiator protein Rep
LPTIPDFQENNQFLSDISPKDKPWDIHKLQATKVSFNYHQVGNDKYSQRVEDCSKWLQFCLYDLDDGSLTLKLFNAKFCRVRQCPICQWRRSLMWLARFFRILPEFKADNPKTEFLFLTLTVKNCKVEDLRETIASMQKGWKKLTERKCYPAIASIRSLEITRAADGLAHPHFHCLLAVPPSYFGKAYLSQDKWTNLWRSCLKIDYTPIVDVRKVKILKDSDLDSAFRETLKYSIKPSDLISDPEFLGELTKQLHKVRAVSIGGLFRKYLSEEEPEDLISENNEDKLLEESQGELTFGWRENYNRYTKIN